MGQQEATAINTFNGEPSSNTEIAALGKWLPDKLYGNRQINLQDGTVDGKTVLSGVIETDDGMRGNSIDYLVNDFHCSSTRLTSSQYKPPASPKAMSLNLQRAVLSR